MEDLISIIVPIYNVEEFLPRCIDSIINQTYQNLEIILVNDGSPDKCPEICNEYAKRDNRIRVVHQVNSGLSGARNAGLSICTGKYIAFVDSDDWIDENHIMLLYQAIKKYGVDVVCSGFVDCFLESGNRIIRCPNKKDKVFNQTQTLDNYYGKYCPQITVAWNKLYKASIFENLRYESMIYEDSNILIKLIAKLHKLALIPYATYFYQKRSQSLVGGSINKGRVDSLIKLCSNRINYIKQYFPQYFSQEVALRLTDIGSMYRQCSDIELKQTLKNLFNNYWLSYKKYLKIQYRRTFKCYIYRLLIMIH